MLVLCDLHVARNVLCTAISRAVVINTRDFTKKLGTSQKYTRVLHSRVSSLNRAVPYITTHISGGSCNIVAGKSLMKLVKKLEGWMSWMSWIGEPSNHFITISVLSHR